MKTEWVHKKLGDCCESELGKTLDEGRNTGLYRPYLCALNVLWGKIDISFIKQMRIEDSELERYLVKKGDLLVCEGGEIGRCAIWENDDEIYYQNALHRVRFYKEYDAYFFMYLLYHYNDLKLIEQYGKGLTIKHLNQTAFRNIPVCVPDLSAQRRIAAILASADKVIAATQKTIAKYKQIKQGMMEDLLKPKEGWKKVRLGEVGTFKNGINKDKSQFGFGTKYVSISDAYLEEINYKTLNRLNATDKEIEEYSLFTGDIVFVRSSVKPSGVGYTTLFGDYDKEPVLFSGFMIRYRLNDNINYCPSFMNYLLRDERFRLQVISKSTVSANTNINQESLKELSCSIPNIAEQRRIASILSGIDAKIAAEEKVLEKYEKVKKGLMERLLEEENER